MQKLRIVTLGLARRDREWSLDDGRIPNPNVVRVAPSTWYHRVEGNRRASRNGRVSDPRPEIPTVTIRNCRIVVHLMRTCAVNDSAAASAVSLAASDSSSSPACCSVDFFAAASASSLR
jgi:hypothetical protein